MNRKAITLLAIGVAFGLVTAASADVGSQHNGNGAGGTVNVDFSEEHNHGPVFIDNFPDPPTFLPDALWAGTNFDKTFNEVARHELTYNYEDEVYGGFFGPGPFIEPGVPQLIGDGLQVEESIINNSGVGWSGYRFGVEDAEVLVPCNPSNNCEGFGQLVSVSSLPENIIVSGIFVFDGFDLGEIDVDIQQEENEGPIVTFTFGNELPAGQAFDFEFYVNTLGAPDNPLPSECDDQGFCGSFDMFEEPIPIPAPGAAVLAVIGFGAVGWVRRRVG